MSNVLKPCPICHESLLPKALEALRAPLVEMVEDPDGYFVVNAQHPREDKIGATSCGHCFHMNCYEEWERQANSQVENHTICPLCNLPTVGFKEIYNLNEHPTSTADRQWLVRSRFDVRLATTLNEVCSAFRQRWDELVSSPEEPLVKLKLDHRDMTIQHLFCLFVQMPLWASAIFLRQFEVWVNWLFLVQEEIDLRIRSVMGSNHKVETDDARRKRRRSVDLNEFQRAAHNTLEELHQWGASVQAATRHAFIQDRAVEVVATSFAEIRSANIMTRANAHFWKQAYMKKVYECLKYYYQVQHDINSTDGTQNCPMRTNTMMPGQGRGGLASWTTITLPPENHEQDAAEADAMPNEQEDAEDQEVALQQGVPQGGHNFAASFTFLR
jgi:hypothetical protein